MALIHSYFVDIFLHGKLLHSSASRTHVTIYDVKKCQQNTRESMPKCKKTIASGKVTCVFPIYRFENSFTKKCDIVF